MISTCQQAIGNVERPYLEPKIGWLDSLGAQLGKRYNGSDPASGPSKATKPRIPAHAGRPTAPTIISGD